MKRRISLNIFLLFILSSNGFSTIIEDDFPKLEKDSLIIIMNNELTEVLNSQLSTDEELQNIEGSGENKKLEESFLTTSTTTLPPKLCSPLSDCLRDSDCVDGLCLGGELGICDCNACISNRYCTSDIDCGGLRNSCNLIRRRCDCVEGFRTNGFKYFVSVLRTFCHQQKCTAKGDNCFGLPCRIGKCRCNQIKNQ